MTELVKSVFAAEPQALSVQEFCVRNRMSLTTWHKLRKEGRAPETMQYGSVTRITVEAERAWHKKMQAEQVGQAAKLERERRQALAVAAAKAAVASPSHVSKKKRRAAARA